MSLDALVLDAARPLERLIAKYEGRAPRYTSYPTALQFSPAVGADTYRDWLSTLDPSAPVSLYVHIPFCARLCWYCGCNTRAVNHHAPVGDYLDLLVQELRLLGDALPGQMGLRALHLGGGTPNTLTPEDLTRLFGALGETFRIGSDLDVAAELDPTSLTPDWVKAARGLGLNRASLGVQTLDPKVQAAVNRPEPYDHIAACVEWLREAGVDSVNLDLMYGLPHQTTGSVLETVEQILALRPERIALFGYAHVPWMKAHQALIDETALPDSAERLDQSESAAERLVAEGYVRIGLDHFALPGDDLARAPIEGRLRRNFQGYTSDPPTPLLGVGASAIGQFPQGFVQNATQELAWRAAIGAGQLAVVRGVETTAEDRFRGEIIERLMCDLQVDLAAICRRHGRGLDALASEWARLGDFEADGLVWRAGDCVVVTELGRVLVRSICAVFDQYFAAGGARHAKSL